MVVYCLLSPNVPRRSNNFRSITTLSAGNAWIVARWASTPAPLAAQRTAEPDHPDQIQRGTTGKGREAKRRVINTFSTDELVIEGESQQRFLILQPFLKAISNGMNVIFAVLQIFACNRDPITSCEQPSKCA